MLGAAPAVIKLGAAVRRAVSHPRPGSGMLRAPLRATGLGGARGGGGQPRQRGARHGSGDSPRRGWGVSQGCWRASRKVPGAAPKGVVGGASGSGLVNGGGVPQHVWGDVLQGLGASQEGGGTLQQVGAHPTAHRGQPAAAGGSLGLCPCPGALSMSWGLCPCPKALSLSHSSLCSSPASPNPKLPLFPSMNRSRLASLC